MAKKPSIKAGDTFESIDGEILTVVEYQSATKVLVSWPDGTTLLKSAQQLRNSTASRRTRKSRGVEETPQTPPDTPVEPVKESVPFSKCLDTSDFVKRVNDEVVSE